MAGASLPKATAAVGIIFDKAGKQVVLTLKGENGAIYDVKLDPGIIGGVVAALVGLGNSIASLTAQQAGGAPAQIMRVTGSQAGLNLQGQPILDLILEGSLHFPITFPPQGIEVLKKQLSELQAKTGLKH